MGCRCHLKEFFEKWKLQHTIQKTVICKSSVIFLSPEVYITFGQIIYLKETLGSDYNYWTKIGSVNSSSWHCVYYNDAIVKRWKYYFSRDFDIYYYWRKMRGNFWGNVWCRHFHPPLSVWYVSPYLWMTYVQIRNVFVQ